MENTSNPMEETSTDNTPRIVPRIVNPSPIRATSRRLIPSSDRFKHIMNFLEYSDDTDDATPKEITEAMNKNNDNVDNPRTSQIFARRMLTNCNCNKVIEEGSPESPSPSPPSLVLQANRLFHPLEAIDKDADANIIDPQHTRRQYWAYKLGILRDMATNNRRIRKALEEAISAKTSKREEDYQLRMKEYENCLHLQRSYSKMMRRSPRWSPYSVPPPPPVVDDNAEDDVCLKLLAEVLSLKETAAAGDTRVSNRAKSDMRGGLAMAEAVKGEPDRRGGPMRRRRRPHLVDVNNMVDNLRNLTL